MDSTAHGGLSLTGLVGPWAGLWGPQLGLIRTLRAISTLGSRWSFLGNAAISHGYDDVCLFSARRRPLGVAVAAH